MGKTNFDCAFLTFSEDSVKPINGMFVARTRNTVTVTVLYCYCIKATSLHNTHFRLSSGGSFMSFCILETKKTFFFIAELTPDQKPTLFDEDARTWHSPCLLAFLWSHRWTLFAESWIKFGVCRYNVLKCAHMYFHTSKSSQHDLLVKGHGALTSAV